MSDSEKPKKTAAPTTTAAPPKKKMTLKQKLAEKERLAAERVSQGFLYELLVSGLLREWARENGTRLVNSG